jgi:dTDP-4-dehydrorhamnose reductase
LYIGTAGIFNGRKEIYDDWDLPDPHGVYARSKYAGELFVKENAGKFLICRPGWMMGSGPSKDKKFVNKLMKKIKNGEKELFIVNDKGGTPTYTHDFAKNVKLLVEKEFWGLYNMACGGQTNRAEVAAELLKLLHLENQIKITLVSSDYYKNEYYAPRPDCERIINKKLDLRHMNIMPDWKSALKEYITNYFQNYLR